MTFQVIENPNHTTIAGFTAAQFRKLDALYINAMRDGILNYRTVECDFDKGVASYTYYKSQHHAPYLQFIIRKVGPHSMHYELFKMEKGCIEKSSLFERTYDKLRQELESTPTLP